MNLDIMRGIDPDNYFGKPITKLNDYELMQWFQCDSDRFMHYLYQSAEALPENQSRSVVVVTPKEPNNSKKPPTRAAAVNSKALTSAILSNERE